MPSRPNDPSAFARVLARVRAGRCNPAVRCPRCTREHVHRSGQFSGRQRFLCLHCRRTFSDFTGTPIAYSKKPELWPDYAICLADSLTIRQTAATLGLSVSTAFRWRHAFLTEIRHQDRTVLRGWIELSDLWFPVSEKGSRTLGRRARHRGVASRLQHAGASVRVTIGSDRAGGIVSDVVYASRVSARDLECAFRGRIGALPIVVAAQGPLGPCAVFARRAGGAFRECRRTTGPPADPRCHLRTVTHYASRFRHWLLRFCGVATRYLVNYLGWHRLIDRSLTIQPEVAAMWWPVVADGL